VGTDKLVGLTDIQAAAERVAPAVRRTPLLATSLGAPGTPLFVKAESLQLGGSFKLRGAMNAVAQLSEAERARGVITHSSGNHGQALARAAKAAGIAATVVMPHQSPSIKRVATEALGARVVLVDIADRAAAVERIRAATGAVFIPSFESSAVIAGQGTLGVEILADLPDVATVVVPVSGGGLISGVSAAVRALSPATRIVAVEPELAGDLAEGFARGQRVTWSTEQTGRTIADGLRVPAVGELSWRHIRAFVDTVVTVSEAAIRSAMRRIVLGEKLVCEPSGAVAVAGCLEHPEVLAAGPVVAVLSGGNVDPALLAEVLVG
jgi:threonine dehydratase